MGISNGVRRNFLWELTFPFKLHSKKQHFFGVRCSVASTLPTAAYIRSELAGKIVKERFGSVPGHFPESTLPIVPFQTPKISADLRGNQRLSSGNRLSLRQLPFIPSFASTTYKVQGLTVGGLVAFPFLKGSPISPPFAALYVSMSRVRTFKALFLSEQITEDHIKHFVPPNNLLVEDERLENLHNETVSRFEQ